MSWYIGAILSEQWCGVKRTTVCVYNYSWWGVTYTVIGVPCWRDIKYTRVWWLGVTLKFVVEVLGEPLVDVLGELLVAVLVELLVDVLVELLVDVLSQHM